MGWGITFTGCAAGLLLQFGKTGIKIKNLLLVGFLILDFFCRAFSDAPVQSGSKVLLFCDEKVVGVRHLFRSDTAGTRLCVVNFEMLFLF